MQVVRHYHPLRRSLEEIEEAIKRFRQEADMAHTNQELIIRTKKDEEFVRLEKKRAATEFEASQKRDAELKQAALEHAAAVRVIEDRKETELKAADADHQTAIAELTQRHEDALGQADRQYQHQRRTTLAAHDRDWQAMADKLRKGFSRVQNEAISLERETGQFSFDWDGENGASDWSPADEIPPLYAWGSFASP